MNLQNIPEDELAVEYQLSIRVLLVDQEEATQQLVAAHLEQSGFMVDFASSAEQAEVAIRSALPDLLIIDWTLPGQSGIALVENIRSTLRTREIPIIMLSARGADADQIQGLDAGADDYVSKPFSPGVLLARVRAVLRRRSPHLSGQAVKVGTLTLNPVTHRAMAGGKPINLGPTEFRLLTFLMTHPERLYARHQLLDEVWGDHIYVSERTVDVHVRRLRVALQASGNHDRLETVRGGGYRFRGE